MMRPIRIALYVLILSMTIMVPEHPAVASPSALTPALVKKIIREKLYPASNDDSVSKTTLKFHRIRIAKSRVLHVGELYGFAGGTRIYPVLAQFTSTNRSQLDPKGKAQYDVHDITQLYYFYRNDFGDWALSLESGSENRDVEKYYAK